jgi:hypothetical protein
MFFDTGVRENQKFLSTVEPRNVHYGSQYELLQEGGGGGGGYGRCRVGKVFVY